MKLLLDSHAFIWAVDDPSMLGADAARVLIDPANELLLSAATIWELAIKVSLAKLRLTLPYRQWMERSILDLGVVLIPITVEYADVQAQLPYHHGDPFDRLLIAQAKVDDVTVISGDVIFDQYGVSRIW